MQIDPAGKWFFKKLLRLVAGQLAEEFRVGSFCLHHKSDILFLDHTYRHPYRLWNSMHSVKLSASIIGDNIIILIAHSSPVKLGIYNGLDRLFLQIH